MAEPVELRDAVIVDACRTPNGRAHDGALSRIRAEDLLVHALSALLERNPSVDPSRVADLVVGCSMPESEQGMNLARRAGLLAGLPLEVPGLTVNRFCAAGFDAALIAARAIACGEADTYLAAGVESISHIPLGGFRRADALHPKLVREELIWTITQTAQNVHEEYAVSREEMDAFALESHMKAARAARDGMFDAEIVPLEVPVDGRADATVTFAADECVQPDTSAARLAALEPVADVVSRSGRPVEITAGNSGALADGAGALLVMEENRARELGYERLTRIAGHAAVGVHPRVMGIGPVPAARKALERADIGASDLDIVELNEAFASQAVASIRALELDESIVNPNGGAIALGLAPGQAGIRLLGTLFHGLHRSPGRRYGLAAICVSGGQGVAVVLEKI